MQTLKTFTTGMENRTLFKEEENQTGELTKKEYAGLGES